MIRKISISMMLALMSTMAFASDFDGSKRLLCAVVETVECNKLAACIAGPPETIYAPDFFRLDLKAKRMSAERFGKKIDETKIASVYKLEDRIVFQGMEDNRGWSGVLDKNSGRLTMSASDNGFSFLLFGSCDTL